MHPPPPPPFYLYTQIPLLPVINKWGEGGWGLRNSKGDADYILFRQVFELVSRKEHLTTEGLHKILSIKASMNKGLSDKLTTAFPNITPVPRPHVALPESIDPYWLAGFVSGEGCFSIHIFKDKTASPFNLQPNARTLERSNARSSKLEARSSNARSSNARTLEARSSNARSSKLEARTLEARTLERSNARTLERSKLEARTLERSNARTLEARSSNARSSKLERSNARSSNARTLERSNARSSNARTLERSNARTLERSNARTLERSPHPPPRWGVGGMHPPPFSAARADARIVFTTQLIFKTSQHHRDMELLKSFMGYLGCGQYSGSFSFSFRIHFHI